jgi:hypothetical protein
MICPRCKEERDMKLFYTRTGTKKAYAGVCQPCRTVDKGIYRVVEKNYQEFRKKRGMGEEIWKKAKSPTKTKTLLSNREER